MGLYRTIRFRRACERCDREVSQDLQFKTDCDYQQEYRLGQIVTPDDVFHRGGRYRGIVSRYCGPCTRDWSLAANSAWVEIVTEALDQGKLEVWRRDGSAPLTAEDLRRNHALGHEVFDVQLDAEGNVASLASVYPVEFRWTHLKPGQVDETYFQAQLALTDAFHQRLKTTGWECGWEVLREDVEVFIDDDSRIQIHFPGHASPGIPP